MVGRTRAAAILLLVLAAGCAAGPESRWPAGTTEPAGFFAGLWHGLILLLSFLASLVFPVGVYEVHNSGAGYDAGFVLGVMLSLGGGGAASGRGLRPRAGKDDLADAIGDMVRERMREARRRNGENR